MTMPSNIRGRTQDESGFIIVLFALLLVFLMTMGGLVLDFGQVRDDRQTNKSSADLATLAAMQLIDHPSDRGVPRPWRGACAALQWMQADHERFRGLALTYKDGTGAPVSGDPCTLPFPPPCVKDTPSTWAWITGTSADGDVQVDIKAGYRLPDPAFPTDEEPGYLGDDGTEGGCDNLAVIVHQARARGFGAVAGSDDLNSRVRSVGRFDIEGRINRVAALLLLERVGCEGLQTSGQGAITIDASAANNPGIIHADSAGQVGGAAGCTTNENSRGYVVWGTALPSGGPSIVAVDSSDGTPGTIELYSLAAGGRGGAVYPGGLSAAPTAGPIISRAPADRRYNPADRPAVSELHSRGYLATTSVAPAGHTVISGAQCSGLAGTVSSANGIYVSCPTFSPDSVTLDAPQVTFTGRIDIANNKRLVLPQPARVYVRGCAGTCSGSPAISVAGTFEVNVGNPPAAACTSRTRAQTSNTTELATFGGSLDARPNGILRMCQTFAYIGANTTGYVQQSLLTGGNCSTDLPCPKDTGTGSGFVNVQGTYDWSAPNQLSTLPQDSDLITHPFEDLALWTESANKSDLKGPSASRVEGVYFTPNATVEFTGQSTQAQPLNAQFFTRRLNFSGQGNLYMKPNPNDAVSAPVLAGFKLVR